MKNPRSIVIKSLFNPDEFLAFRAKCESEDITQSRAIRELANDWSNVSSLCARMERPERVPKLNIAARGRNKFHHQRL
jgi:hypothetical protein